MIQLGCLITLLPLFAFLVFALWTISPFIILVPLFLIVAFFVFAR